MSAVSLREISEQSYIQAINNHNIIMLLLERQIPSAGVLSFAGGGKQSEHVLWVGSFSTYSIRFAK